MSHRSQKIPRRTSHCARVTARIYSYDPSEPWRARVEDECKHGTCFAVKLPCGKPALITNCHCVENAYGDVLLSFEHVAGPGDVRTRVQVACPELDFALLEFTHEAQRYLQPMNARYDPLDAQDELVMAADGAVAIQGFPLGDGCCVRTAVGSFAGTKEHYMQFTASLNHGNSGGAVISTATQQAIAIATATVRDADQIGLGIPLYFVAAALQRRSDTNVLLRVRHLHDVRVAPCTTTDEKRLKLGCRAGARVLTERDGLLPDDVVVSIDGMPITPNGGLCTPHNFAGAPLEALETALAVSDEPEFTVKRMGVDGLLRVNVSMRAASYGKEIYPLWERAGTLHYLMLGEQLCFVPKTDALIKEFTPNLSDKFLLSAAAAADACMVCAWVCPGSEAEIAGIEPLFLLSKINDQDASTPEAVLKLTAPFSARRRNTMKLKFAHGDEHTLQLNGPMHIVQF